MRERCKGWGRWLYSQVDQKRRAGYSKITSCRRGLSRVHTSGNRSDHEASWMLIANDRNAKWNKFEESKHNTDENKRQKRRRFGLLIRLRDWPNRSRRGRQMIIDRWLDDGEGSERHANGILLRKIPKWKNLDRPGRLSVVPLSTRKANVKHRSNGRETASSVGVPTDERRETRQGNGTTGNASDGRTISADRTQSTTIVKLTI